MTKPTQNRLIHFPVGFFTTVMGMTGLSLSLAAAERTLGLPAFGSLGILTLAIVVFVALACVYCIKFTRHPDAVRGEWAHPVKLAFFPAISISLLLIGTALQPVNMGLAHLIWLIGAVAQGILTFAVIAAWIGARNFEMGHLMPVWFIPAVGNVVVPLGGIGFGYVDLSWMFFATGMIFWVVLLVLVMNRLIFHDPLPSKMRPTLAIFIAPPAVGFLAWVQINGGQLDMLARFLFSAAMVFFALALTQVPKLRGVPFALPWWALSFPIAALSIATLHYGGMSGSWGHIWAGYGLVIGVMGIVGVLFIRTIIAIARNEICKPE